METSRLGFVSHCPGMSGGQRGGRMPRGTRAGPGSAIVRKEKSHSCPGCSAATFRREPGALSAHWQKASQGSSPSAFTTRVGGGWWRPPPAGQWRVGGPGGPEAYFPVSPKPSKHAPSRPDALLDPNALCHREPGTEPVFFISSHLLWQPRVCLVFTSRDAWKLSLLDHTRGASQHFPSSADIFLVMSVVSTAAFPPELSQEQQGSSCS